MELEIGQVDGHQWQELGSFAGPVSKEALHHWAKQRETAAGTYEVREPGNDKPRYLFRVGPDCRVETVATLDLD